MKQTLVDLFELRETEIEVDVEIEEEQPPSTARLLKILTPTKPLRPWLSEEH